MKIIGFLFILGLIFFALTLLFGFSFLRLVLGAIFGTGPKSRNTSSNKQKSKPTAQQTSKQTKPIRKIITHEEGEYVDFEEIKD
jgi:hypothetical protein